MSKINSYTFAILSCTAAVIASPTGAHAVSYLSIEDAQQVLFPNSVNFKKLDLDLADEVIEAIEEDSGADFEKRDLRVWQAQGANGLEGYFIIDDVWGKHEYITYALAINLNGQVLGVEITDYREAHGMEVIDPEWRRNFVGLGVDNKSQVKLQKSIPNISGATMSCRHVTDGVRRNLTLFEKVLKNHGNS